MEEIDSIPSDHSGEGNNKVLIILGMHRSGTSLTGNWLERCGLDIGDQLIGPWIGNNDGHFEDVEFHQVHEEIFKRKGVSTGGLEGKLDFVLTEADFSRIQGIVENKMATKKQWGWKEPRTCLFLDAYRRIIPDAYYFIVFRRSEEVVSSLLRREFTLLADRIKRDFSKSAFVKQVGLVIKLYKPFWLVYYRHVFLNTWIKYNEAILEHISQVERANLVAILIDRLIENDRVVFSQLTGWGFQLKYNSIQSILKGGLMKKSEAGIFLNPFLKKRADKVWEQIVSITLNQEGRKLL